MGRPIITLTTDFGSRFSYVAEMKGVILDALNGDVELVDVTHDIEPQSIAEAELWLRDSWRLWGRPSGRCGSRCWHDRRPIAGAWRSHYFVGPDNGIFGRI